MRHVIFNKPSGPLSRQSLENHLTSDGINLLKKQGHYNYSMSRRILTIVTALISSDALHLNTMLSPNLTEIGAGVAVSGGRVYFVIDCARPTTNGAPQASTSVAGDGSAVPAREAPIAFAIVSTPDSNGDVIHEVQFGQTLWQLAIAYNVKIDEIKSLNNLFDNNIYPGNKLLIKRGVVQITTAQLWE